MNPQNVGSSALDKMKRQLKNVVFKTNSNKETVFAFIDAQNIAKGIETAGWKINWSTFRKWLVKHYNVSEAHMYIGYMVDNRDLYLQLNNNGFIINLKEILPAPNSISSASSEVKGNVDVDLTIGVWQEFNNYDKAIIVSGDGDFSSLIQHLRDQNKLSAIIVPQLYSSLFKQFDEYIVELSNYKEELVYVKKSKAKKKPPSLRPTKRQKIQQILTHDIHLPSAKKDEPK